MKKFLEQTSNDSEKGSLSGSWDKGGSEDYDGNAVLSKLAVLVVDHMEIPIEELEEKFDFTSLVKLCRIGQKIVQGKQDNPHFYFWSTIENRIVFRRIVNAMDLSLIAPMEALIAQFTSSFLDPNDDYSDLFKIQRASSIVPLFYMELGQVHFIRGNYGDAYKIFEKVKSNVGADFKEAKKLECLLAVSEKLFLKKEDPDNFYSTMEELITKGDFRDGFFNLVIDNCFCSDKGSLRTLGLDARIPEEVRERICCMDALWEFKAYGSETQLYGFDHNTIQEVAQMVTQRSSDKTLLARVDKILDEDKKEFDKRRSEENEEEHMLEPPEAKTRKMSKEGKELLETFGEKFDTVEDGSTWEGFYTECGEKCGTAMRDVLKNLVQLRTRLLMFLADKSAYNVQGNDASGGSTTSNSKVNSRFDKYNIKQSFTGTVARMMSLHTHNSDDFFLVLKSFKSFEFLQVLSSMTFGSLFKLSKKKLSKQAWINETGTFERYRHKLCKVMQVLIPDRVKDAKPIAEFFSLLSHFQWDNFKETRNAPLAYAIGDAHFFNLVFENVGHSTDCSVEDKLECEAKTALKWYTLGAFYETDAFSLFNCAKFKTCLLNVITCLQTIDKKRGGQIIKILLLAQLLPPGVEWDEETQIEPRKEFGLQNDCQYLQLFWDIPTLEKLSRKTNKDKTSQIIHSFIFFPSVLNKR